jgi:hypothetical protein
VRNTKSRKLFRLGRFDFNTERNYVSNINVVPLVPLVPLLNPKLRVGCVPTIHAGAAQPNTILFIISDSKEEQRGTGKKCQRRKGFSRSSCRNRADRSGTWKRSVNARAGRDLIGNTPGNRAKRKDGNS